MHTQDGTPANTKRKDPLRETAREVGSAAERAFAHIVGYLFRGCEIAKQQPDTGVDHEVDVNLPFTFTEALHLRFQVKKWPTGTLSAVVPVPGFETAAVRVKISDQRLLEYKQSTIPTYLVVMKPPPPNVQQADYLQGWTPYVVNVQSLVRDLGTRIGAHRDHTMYVPISNRLNLSVASLIVGAAWLMREDRSVLATLTDFDDHEQSFDYEAVARGYGHVPSRMLERMLSQGDEALRQRFLDYVGYPVSVGHCLNVLRERGADDRALVLASESTSMEVLFSSFL